MTFYDHKRSHFFSQSHSLKTNWNFQHQLININIHWVFKNNEYWTNALYTYFTRYKTSIASEMINWFINCIHLFYSCYTTKNKQQKTKVPPTVKASNQLVGAPVESHVLLQCIVEAYPKPLNGWYRNEGIVWWNFHILFNFLKWLVLLCFYILFFIFLHIANWIFLRSLTSSIST